MFLLIFSDAADADFHTEVRKYQIFHLHIQEAHTVMNESPAIKCILYSGSSDRFENDDKPISLDNSKKIKYRWYCRSMRDKTAASTLTLHNLVNLVSDLHHRSILGLYALLLHQDLRVQVR